MDKSNFEKLGLNKNEAKVYVALLGKGQATAAELVKSIGVHRNIVYDNLEKLIEKGFVSFIIEGKRRTFIAEDPDNILSFLELKKKSIEDQVNLAKTILPEIKKKLGSTKAKQEATLFKGAKGVKKVLSMALNSKEYWDIGVTNTSVELLGKTYWKNFNIKVHDYKIKEHLLFNPDFENIVNIRKTKLREFRILPAELTQASEIMLFDNKVAFVIYSETPIVTLIEDSHLFETFKKQFQFLWKQAKKQ